jgi:hypothetical protein
MATRRLFEHGNEVHLYLLWILQTWTVSFIIEDENRVKKSGNMDGFL